MEFQIATEFDYSQFATFDQYRGNFFLSLFFYKFAIEPTLTTSIGFDATAPAKPATPLALKLKTWRQEFTLYLK